MPKLYFFKTEHPKHGSGYAQRKKDRDWLQVERFVRQWHDDGLTRQQIRDRLLQEKSFDCSSGQLQARMTRWGVGRAPARLATTHETQGQPVTSNLSSQQHSNTNSNDLPGSRLTEQHPTGSSSILLPSTSFTHHLPRSPSPSPASSVWSLRSFPDHLGNGRSSSSTTPASTYSPWPAIPCPKINHEDILAAPGKSATHGLPMLTDVRTINDLQNTSEAAELLYYGGSLRRAHELYQHLVSHFASKPELQREYFDLYLQCIIGSLRSLPEPLKTGKDSLLFLSRSLLLDALGVQSKVMLRTIYLIMMKKHSGKRDLASSIQKTMEDCGHLTLSITPSLLYKNLAVATQLPAQDVYPHWSSVPIRVHLSGSLSNTNHLFLNDDPSPELSMWPAATYLLRQCIEIVFRNPTVRTNLSQILLPSSSSQSHIRDSRIFQLFYWTCVSTKPASIHADNTVAAAAAAASPCHWAKVSVLARRQTCFELQGAEILHLLAKLMTDYSKIFVSLQGLENTLCCLCGSEDHLRNLILGGLSTAILPETTRTTRNPSGTVEDLPGFASDFVRERFREAAQLILPTCHAYTLSPALGGSGNSHSLSGLDSLLDLLMERKLSEESEHNTDDTELRSTTTPPDNSVRSSLFVVAGSAPRMVVTSSSGEALSHDRETTTEPSVGVAQTLYSPNHDEAANQSRLSADTHSLIQYSESLKESQKSPRPSSTFGASSILSAETTESNLSDRLAAALSLAPITFRKYGYRPFPPLTESQGKRKE